VTTFRRAALTAAGGGKARVTQWQRDCREAGRSAVRFRPRAFVKEIGITVKQSRSLFKRRGRGEG